MNHPLLPALCRIAKRHDNSEDVFTLQLQPPGEDWQFRPGQFNMLYIPGAGEVAISISGDPEDSKSIQHTIRSVGNVTGLLQGKQAAEKIGLRGPFGKGWPVQESEGKDLVIVAGGIGIAPLRPVLLETLHRRDRFGKITMFYGARSPRDILFADELMQWKREGKIELIVTVDCADTNWPGDVGMVTDPLRRLSCVPENTVAMLCGPEIMMRFSVKVLRELGMHRQDIYVSLERSMKCAVGFCGHCQVGPKFVCKQGPVFPYAEVERYMLQQEF